MLGIFLVILACFLWATDALIRYPLLSSISPLQLVFYEHSVLFVVFLPYLIKMRERFYKTTISEIFYFFIIGGIGSAGATIAFSKAFTLMNPSLVILLQKFQPLVAILLARLVLGESISNKFLVWASICLIGAVLISYDDLKQVIFGNDIQQSLEGYFYVALSVIGWGATTVFGKKLSENYTHVEVMCGRFIMAFCVLVPLVFQQQITLSLEFASAYKILIMVFLSGLMAMFFYYKGLKKISAKTAALTELFFPFCAVIINWMILNKSLTELQLVGGALLLIGSFIIQLYHY